MNPNDVIIRMIKQPDGSITHEITFGVNDDDMVPEMEMLAKFLRNCMAIYNKSPAEVEYAEVLAYTDNLAKRTAKAIVMPESMIITEH